VNLITEMIALRQLKIWDSRSVGNVSTNVCAKFLCAPLCIKKAVGIFRELITMTRTTKVAFFDPPSGSKNWMSVVRVWKMHLVCVFSCWNQGHNFYMSFIFVADEWLSVFAGGKSNIEHRDPMQDDPQRRRPDITRAKKYIGWQPQVSCLKSTINTHTYTWISSGDLLNK